MVRTGSARLDSLLRMAAPQCRWDSSLVVIATPCDTAVTLLTQSGTTEDFEGIAVLIPTARRQILLQMRQSWAKSKLFSLTGSGRDPVLLLQVSGLCQ